MRAILSDPDPDVLDRIWNLSLPYSRTLYKLFGVCIRAYLHDLLFCDGELDLLPGGTTTALTVLQPVVTVHGNLPTIQYLCK
jgi:hypothetical protein